MKLPWVDEVSRVLVNVNACVSVCPVPPVRAPLPARGRATAMRSLQGSAGGNSVRAGSVKCHCRGRELVRDLTGP